MKIIYTHRSISDLKRLYEFIVSDSPKSAAKVSLQLQKAVERLNDFPLLGKGVKGKGNPSTVRDLITGNYVIRYLILKSEIHILRIWHGKEDRER